MTTASASALRFDPLTRVALRWFLNVAPIEADRVIALRRRAASGDIGARRDLGVAVATMRARYAERGGRR